MVNVVLALWQVRVNHCSLTRLTDKSGGGEAVVQSSQARWTLERTAKLWWAGISHLCVLPLNTVSLYRYIHLLQLNCSWTIFIYLQFRFSFHLLPGWWSEPLKLTLLQELLEGLSFSTKKVLWHTIRLWSLLLSCNKLLTVELLHVDPSLLHQRPICCVSCSQAGRRLAAELLPAILLLSLLPCAVLSCDYIKWAVIHQWQGLKRGRKRTVWALGSGCATWGRGMDTV